MNVAKNLKDTTHVNNCKESIAHNESGRRQKPHSHAVICHYKRQPTGGYIATPSKNHAQELASNTAINNNFMIMMKSCLVLGTVSVIIFSVHQLLSATYTGYQKAKF